MLVRKLFKVSAPYEKNNENSSIIIMKIALLYI
jgi:hypothetical protein